MPTDTLDLETERHLSDLLLDHSHTKGFTLRDGAELHLHETIPKEKSLLDDIKAKLDPVFDFEHGGAKLYQFDHKGMKGGFILKPGWDKGGPTLMLQFNMRF